ncbi:MAG: hypothetical protein TREMPRED_002193 [Tremellales sp. Tagirdzhanova-0007]|nr:MAG: hypothetical protein TREMPRED_002193 [Tremellales sp. Tagirdzhanova-0007]
MPVVRRAETESRASIELNREAKMIQVTLQTMLDKQTREDPRRSKLAELKARRSGRQNVPGPAEDVINLTSSPPPSSVVDTTDVRTQDTGQPITPHDIGSAPIACLLSPRTGPDQLPPRTSERKRPASRIVFSESESGSDIPQAVTRRDKGKGRAPSPDVYTTHVKASTNAERGKGDWTEPDEYDRAFDEFVDIDFESLSSMVGSRISSIIPHIGRAPTIHNSSHPLKPVSVDHHPSLGKASGYLGIPMLSQLPEEEQEFYRNHWRRGADRAEERRESGGRNKTLNAEVERKKPAYARRGGFRGRMRGRGRGNKRKR